MIRNQFSRIQMKVAKWASNSKSILLALIFGLVFDASYMRSSKELILTNLIVEFVKLFQILVEVVLTRKNLTSKDSSFICLSIHVCDCQFCMYVCIHACGTYLLVGICFDTYNYFVLIDIEAF